MISEHVSVCPISVEYLEPESASLLPLKISDSLFVEDVSKLFRETLFDPMVPKYYSSEEVESLMTAKYALVRRVVCEDSQAPATRVESKKLLYQFYIGLKIIRPTSGRFQVLYYKIDDLVPRQPAGWRNVSATILCDFEILNHVRISDLKELQALAPCISTTLKSAKNPISQAAQSLEIGYSTDFFNVRHLLWVVGLDALFTSRERKNRGKRVAVERIKNLLGPNFQIYPDEPFADLDLPEPNRFLLSDVADDIYRLRNNFAHGTWPDKEWACKVCRHSVASPHPDGNVYYAEQLSEAASVTLRCCLRKILADPRLVEIFRDKAKMNKHFEDLGIVRQ